MLSEIPLLRDNQCQCINDIIPDIFFKFYINRKIYMIMYIPIFPNQIMLCIQTLKFMFFLFNNALWNASHEKL